LYYLISDFKNWSFKEYTWLIIGLAIVCIGSISSSPLDFITAVFNVVSVILIAKGRVSNYYWGVIGSISYATVSYSNNLYGNMILNIIYIILQIWGLFEWHSSRKISEREDVDVNNLKTVHYIILVGCIFIPTVIIHIYIANSNDSSPWLDSFTLGCVP
jgi:nicotinamide mononucleotide transporter